jgi:hypothetical protein
MPCDHCSKEHPGKEPDKTSTSAASAGGIVREARALEWGELLPQTQKALAKLLGVLATATAIGPAEERSEQLSTSILVSGDRGAGKTTASVSVVPTDGVSVRHVMGRRPGPGVRNGGGTQ